MRAPLFQRVAAPVCPFGRIARYVRQRRLGDSRGKDVASPHQSRKAERKP